MRELTHEDKLLAFKRATGRMVRALERWKERGRRSISDAELEQMLKFEMGEGGRGGPNEIDLWWNGSGLRIWASWDIVNHVTTKPILQGASTIAMARVVYGLRDSDSLQESLF